MSFEQELMLIHRTMNVLFRELEHCIHDGDASGANIVSRELWALGQIARAKRAGIDAGKTAA